MKKICFNCENKWWFYNEKFCCYVRLANYNIEDCMENISNASLPPKKKILRRKSLKLQAYEVPVLKPQRLIIEKCLTADKMKNISRAAKYKKN